MAMVMVMVMDQKVVILLITLMMMQPIKKLFLKEYSKKKINEI
jgi:hypothetical protein